MKLTSMSAWKYGEHILVMYDCEQGSFLMFGDTFNLWKTTLEYRGQNFLEDTVRNIIHIEHRRMYNVYKLRNEVFREQIPSLVEVGNINPKKCIDRYSHHSLGITNQTNQSLRPRSIIIIITFIYPRQSLWHKC